MTGVYTNKYGIDIRHGPQMENEFHMYDSVLENRLPTQKKWFAELWCDHTSVLEIKYQNMVPLRKFKTELE